MSLSKKLSIPVVMINLFMIITIYIMSESLIRNKFEEDYIQTIKEQTVSIENVIEKIKAETAETCQFFNNSARILTALQGNNRTSMAEFAADSLNAFDYDLFIVIKKDGTLFFRNDKPDAYSTDMSKDYLPHLTAMQGQMFSDILTIGDQVYICSATPVYDNDGNIIASLTYAYGLSSDNFVDYYGNITDNDMTVFINRTRSMTTLTDSSGKRIIGTDMNDPIVIEEVINNKNHYYGKTILQNKNYLCSYIPLDSQNGDRIIIFLGKDLTDVEKIALKTSRIIIGVIAGITVLSVMVILFFVYIFIKRPITGLTNKLSEIKSENNNICNLAIKVPEKSKDEIGAIGKQLNRLLDEIRNIVESITIVHQKLAGASEALATSSEETSASAAAVSETMSNIAGAAQSQLAMSEDGTAKLNTLSDNLSNIVKNAEQMKNVTNDTGSVTTKGLSSVRMLKKVARDNSELITKISSYVSRLTENSEAISSIVDVMANIASQTNLLSLNASIEAARAGESGKGFSVVAGEIRNLAEQSKVSAENIYNLLSDITNVVKETADLMDSLNQTFQEQNTAVANTEAAFDNISDSIKNTIEYIELVSASLFVMESGKVKIISSIETISEASAISSKSTEEANSSIHNITSAIENVANLAKELNDISIELKNKIQIFIL